MGGKWLDNYGQEDAVWLLNNIVSNQNNNLIPIAQDGKIIKENIQKMIEIKHTKLVKECSNYGIPSTFSNHILEETTIVDELFTKRGHI